MLPNNAVVRSGATVWLCACVAVQAALEPVKLPTEDFGFTYLICAAGGPLAFDYFAGNVEVAQFISPDMKRLKRCVCGCVGVGGVCVCEGVGGRMCVSLCR